jgi:uncharacterized protein YceK
MKIRWLGHFVLPVFLVVCLTSCGSICNLSEGPGIHTKRVRTSPFGGVLWDVEVLQEPCDPHTSILGGVLLVLGGLIDLPFCIAVDTLTLPYTIPKALSYGSSERAPESKEVPEDKK